MTALYRAYDRRGALLYVGVSDDPQRRMDDHERGSAWTAACDRLDVAYYGTRAEALAAETAAIHHERPLHNRAGRPTRTLRPVPVQRALGDADRDLFHGLAAVERARWRLVVARGLGQPAAFEEAMTRFLNPDMALRFVIDRQLRAFASDQGVTLEEAASRLLARAEAVAP